MATHKEKEQEKLKLLYDIYEQPMYRIAYAILHHTEQAEDAVSDAFLRILKNLKKIGDVRSEKTKHYIISIIRSTAINQYRQNQRDSERYTVWDDRILQVPNQKDDMEQLLANIAQEESIAELLEPLNDLDRQIVLMRLFLTGVAFRKDMGLCVRCKCIFNDFVPLCVVIRKRVVFHMDNPPLFSGSPFWHVQSVFLQRLLS